MNLRDQEFDEEGILMSKQHETDQINNNNSLKKPIEPLGKK